MDNSVCKTPQKQTSSQKFYQSSLFCRFVGVQVCLLNDGPNTHYYKTQRRTDEEDEENSRHDVLSLSLSPLSPLLSLSTVQLRYRYTSPDRKIVSIKKVKRRWRLGRLTPSLTYKNLVNVCGDCSPRYSRVFLFYFINSYGHIRIRETERDPPGKKTQLISVKDNHTREWN